MTDAWPREALEHALVDLGAQLHVPERSLWTRVRVELDAPPVSVRLRTPWSQRARLLVVVGAVVLVLLVVTLSVAPARRAVADFLGIGSTAIVRVDRIPARDRPSSVDDLPGRGDQSRLRAELAAAGLGLPAAELVGEPVAWRVDPDGETVVAFADVVLGQRAEGEVPAVKRVAPTGDVESTTVGGRPASWISGSHTRTLGGREYESASALLWTADGVELRLEGNRSLAFMRRVADSIEPA